MQDIEYINKELGTNFCLMAEVNWTEISRLFKGILSKEFIDKFNDKLDWNVISQYQILSEAFIEKHKDKVYWTYISAYQKLSEKFIDRFNDKVDWYRISEYQKLSEPFIKKHKDKVYWIHICRSQKLSEEFIERFQDKVDWFYISCRQKLSEPFIEKYEDRVDWNNISSFQKLSEEFIKRNNLIVNKNNLWQYKSKEFKKEEVIKTGKYECYEDYFIGYKAIRENRYSLYNFQYQYLPGETYESTCDCTSNENSFGLNIGTYEFAKNYLGTTKGIIVKCKVNYEDVGRIVHDGEKIRCFKITVLE